MTKRHIPFNKSYIAGRELYHVAQAVSNGDIKGGGPFTQRCSDWFVETMRTKACLLTPSCTAALELSALLLDIREGDEVILPSFTFTSTANAFALRGARLVFADISADTINIDPQEIEKLISEKTKAICVVHYAGVACDMEKILSIAEQHKIPVVEDAAHAVMAKYHGKYLGTLGDLGTFSFHETKNYSSGEGGALLINQSKYFERAEILREKGTNRSKFFRGEVDKYGWMDVGSSFLPSEIVSAYLYGQLERAEEINQMRKKIWNQYYERLRPLADSGYLTLPTVPDGCEHNGHLFYVLFGDLETRESIRQSMLPEGCSVVFHYLPLHSSPMGKRLGNDQVLPVTDSISDRLLRFPLFCGLSENDVNYICDVLERCVRAL